MQENNMIDLLGSLKEMSSEQLSRLIQEETAKESPNDDLVLMVLDILEDREKKNSVELGPKGKAAWKKYQSKVRTRDRKNVLIWKPLMQIASVLLVITLLFSLLPTQANAETWWERLAKWTDDLFSFLNPNSKRTIEEKYQFQTENEGLQQVYCAIKNLGINEPIVPMWIPEEFDLFEIKTDAIPNQKFVVALFNGDNTQLIINVRIVNDESSYHYHKDSLEPIIYEKYGTIFNILHNNERKTVTWTIDNIECALSVDCQEEVLYKIIESIYRLEYE